MQELIAEMNETANEPMSGAAPAEYRPKLAATHERIRARAETYRHDVRTWLQARAYLSIEKPSDPRAVVAWFHTVVPAKIVRALTGLADDIPERDWPADHDGSAKVALLGIERSHVAWLQMVDRALASRAQVEPFISDLVWIGEEIERVFPHARAFVRPAFDEPDEVAKISAEDGR
jgi:hypothetical protein